MKKRESKASDGTEMRAEYDFSGGVRGKYAGRLKEQGYTIRVYADDGTYTERTVLGEKVIVLDPDVWAYFPDSEAVNKALRALIAIVPPHPANSTSQGDR